MAQHCPVCSRRLKPLVADGITVDVCHGGCGGLWFDNFELEKFRKPHDDAGDALLNVPFDPAVKVDHRRKRHCPKCRDMPMRRHYYSRFQQVEVDSCPNCGGYWLDCGELARVRRDVKDAAALKKLAHAYAVSTVKPKLAVMRETGGEEAKNAGLIKRLFSFVGIR